jgi:hypothetical protein
VAGCTWRPMPSRASGLTFFDDDVTRFFTPPPTKCVFLVALGKAGDWRVDQGEENIRSPMGQDTPAPRVSADDQDSRCYCQAVCVS